MSKLENGHKSKKIVYYLLCKDMDVLQGELDLKKGLIKRKGVVCTQDDPCYLARWMSRSSKVTMANQVTMSYIQSSKHNLITPADAFSKSSSNLE